MSTGLVMLIAKASFLLGCMLILAPYVMKLIDYCEEERDKDGEHD